MKKQQTLDARAFGLAAGTIAAALTTLCAIGLATVPGFTTRVASTLIHLDLSEASRELTWGGYFTGLIGWTLGASLIFWAAAVVYNRFSRQDVVLGVSARDFARVNG
jgi:nicotinamide mononucleotide (NMN) deamidase PncC